jgi:alpha-L-rhamnosidase
LRAKRRDLQDGQDSVLFRDEQGMKAMKTMRWAVWGCGLAMAASGMCSVAQGTPTGPAELRVDNLTTPLGLDDAKPHFSWQLRDGARGARQTAYEVEVASSEALLRQGKADVWESGRVAGGQSLNVAYAGPALQASTRYHWRVKVWGADGEAYAASEGSWWETGLMEQAAWRAEWIGFETKEEDAVRHAAAEWIASPDAKALTAEKGKEERFAYRGTAQVTKAVRRATLFATAQDTVSAWVNGEQVLTADPLPPWSQMPWKKFVRADVTKLVKTGVNVVAIEGLHYVANPNGMATLDAPPMMSTLVMEYADGTMGTFGSDAHWKTAIHAAEGWQKPGFEDGGWKAAVTWKPFPGPLGQPAGHPWIPDSVKALRQEFAVKSPVKSARLYATALGEYELFLNGKPVSEDRMAPGWTDYRERLYYQTYDVTALVRQGKNAMGALLAPGWYSTPIEWYQEPNNYGVTPPALRAQLRIEHEDGSVEWVTTGPDWQASRSHILHAELYDGESQDARRMQAGWDEAGFKAEHWRSAEKIEPAPVKIEAQDFQPIRVERKVEAVKMTEPKPGVYVFDFGQNLAGVERVRVTGPAGTTIRLRFAEIVNEDGTLYVENLRTAKATDRFTLAGKGVEEFTPQFTFHGFRYAELTGLPSAPDKDAVSALVLHTAAPFTAEMKTGSAMINQLWSNIVWGQRSNFVGVPTDCPQRDERLGWMADAQVFWRTASYNMDLAAFSRKFGGDMRGTQAGTAFYGIYAPGTWSENTGYGAGWSDAGVIIPWTSWLQTGDTSVIDENWAGMEKYLDQIEKTNRDGLWKNSGTPFGDWLSPEGRTNQVLIGTAYWAYDVTLMREMAHATGRTADEQKYAAQFEKIRAAFQQRFVHADGYVAGADNSPSPFGVINNPNAMSHGGDTQTGYVLALHMNLLPKALRAAAAEKLVAKIEANGGLLGTGFLGTPYLLEELTKAGHADVAYHLLMNTQYPSWGYLVEHGATTTWERWNGDQMKSDPSMNSYNHYAYGAVADWIYRYAAGVDATPLDAGFHTVVLHPEFDARLGSVEFRYPSQYGVVESAWTLTGKKAQWKVTIPANATGLLEVDAVQAAHTALDGTPLAQSRLASATDGGYRLPAGSYSFEVTVD